jgi:hypothetical protein
MDPNPHLSGAKPTGNLKPELPSLIGIFRIVNKRRIIRAHSMILHFMQVWNKEGNNTK